MYDEILLAGNPNVGKTSVFNRLTRSSEHVGNWHGVTVDEKSKIIRYEDKVLKIIDLPGLYSLTEYSPEEGVAISRIMNCGNAVVAVICEARNIKRNLFLALQLLEAGRNVMIVVNMADEIEKKGGKINCGALSEALGVPVIATSAKYGKRIVFPSTSEVYGLCPDREFDEYESPLVLGPIRKERWIYSCIKQMLDRVIWAYGNHEGLKFTLFRPFNFIGPKLDDITAAKEGSSRVLTQFSHNIIHEKTIMLVDGGSQKRSFTFIDDGIDCLMKILENKDSCADGKIFNIGNPYMEFSIRQLAEMLIELFGEYPEYAERAKNAKLQNISAKDYYGEGYQDVPRRVPSIRQAQEILGWTPKTDLKTALKLTLDYHLLKKDYELERIKR